MRLLQEAGFWKEGTDLAYWTNFEWDENNPDVRNLMNEAANTMPALFGGGADEQPGIPTEGGVGGDPETQLTILSSPTLRYYRDPSNGNWYAAYDLPNSDRTIFFDVSDDQITALFGDRPPAYEDRTFRSLAGDENFTYSGNIAEMEGDGSFEDEVERVTVIGLDEGRLPSWAEDDPAVRDLIYIAQAEQKSTSWLIDQIAKLDSFKARFPNIEQIRSAGNMELEQAITGFLEFEAGLRRAVKGIGMEIDAVTPDVVGGLLDQGWSLEGAVMGVSRINRMNENIEAFNSFNAVLVSQGLQPMSTPQDMFDFMEGNAPQEIYDIWEASSVSEAAAVAGLGDVFSAEDAMEYALFSEGSATFQDALGAFQSAAQNILRLRADIDAERYGLSMDELIDLSLGQSPTSGRSMAEIQQNMNRALRAGQAAQQGTRGRPFTGFTSQGVPQQASLGSLRQAT